MLDPGRADDAAEALVGEVVGAEFVAVGQQNQAGVGVQHGGRVQQPGAQRVGQGAAHQEIAVAARQPQGDGAGGGAQFAQGGGQPGRRFAQGVVVADPGVEEVAAQDQGVGLAPGPIQEVVEGAGRLRDGLAQVDVRGDPDGASQCQSIQPAWRFR